MQQDYGVRGVDLAERVGLGGGAEDGMIVGGVDGGWSSRGGFDLESRRGGGGLAVDFEREQEWWGRGLHWRGVGV